MTTKETNKLDKMWREIIHQQGKCAVCGKTGRLEAHHIFTRSKRSTRWLVENGILLCSACHKFSPTLSAHKAPYAFFKWIEQRNGKKWLEDLAKKSNEVSKQTFENIKKYLENYETKKMG